MIKNCLICAKEFKTYPHLTKINLGKYCSKECSNIGRTVFISKECKNCKKEFNTKPYLHQIYCSFQCVKHTFNIGKKFSEKTKSRMSRSRKGKRMGKFSHKWKGGKTSHSEGYIAIYSPNHPFKGKSNYVLEHRIVMEKHLERYLTPKEKTHHLGEKDDNRPHMLMAFSSQSAHMRFHKDPKNVKPSEIVFDGRKLK